MVHRIDEESPFFELTAESWAAQGGEIIALLSGADEATEQVVNSRRSYRFHQIFWGMNFGPIVEPPTVDTPVTVDLHRLYDVERP